MSSEKEMLSVEEVLELQPGDAENATWINPGFIAVVRKITTKQTKAGKEFFPCVLGSQTGSAELEVSYFTRPKFSEGDLIEISGQGLRRTEYQGKPQAACGQKTETHILGKSAHAPEHEQRRAAGQPPVSGQGSFPVAGQTVGMAMKESIALAGMAADGITRAKLADPLFWADVKIYASNIIRLSRSLEAGKLSPPSWPVAQPAEAPTPAAAPAGGRADAPRRSTSKPQPGPGGSAFPDNQEDDPDEIAF